MAILKYVFFNLAAVYFHLKLSRSNLRKSPVADSVDLTYLAKVDLIAEGLEMI